jgi:SAM-dependent methyltransferase
VAATYKPSVTRLLDKYYPLRNGVRSRDGTEPFYRWLLTEVPSSAYVLNVGAGPMPDESGRCLKGRFKRHVGVDPDPVVLTNGDLDEAYVNDGVALPFDAGTFDAVYSDWTVEHVDRPIPFLEEICRVLKPAGSYFFRTTNSFHYMTLISALTPHVFHRIVANRARVLATNAHDPWPTRYRMNRPRAIENFAHRAGFGVAEVRTLESHPSYLMFNGLAFRFGVAYERLVNGRDSLATCRLIILARLRKGH